MTGHKSIGNHPLRVIDQRHHVTLNGHMKS